jgi:hypothetical protein
LTFKKEPGFGKEFGPRKEFGSTKAAGLRKDDGSRKDGPGKFAPRDFKGKPEERQEPTKVRTSNVWMAPGARPHFKKGSEAASAPSPRKRSDGKGGRPGKGKSGADRRR